MIKLIVSDLDGTLLGDDHITIPAVNREVLCTAHERGKKIVIATGRTYSISKNIVEQLPCDYLINSNGALTLDMSNGGTIARAEIPYESGEKILRILRETGSVHSIFCGKSVYMEEQYVAEFRRAVAAAAFSEQLLSGMALVPDLLDAVHGRDIEKIDIHNLKAGEKQRFIERISMIAPWNVSSSYHGSNVEITAPKATKGQALEALCGHLHFSPSEVMAFGDSDNDIDMLRFAAYSYAMDNAAPDIKAAASYTAAGNTEGGVGLAIKQYLENECF